ncbi:hypothetical protein RHGRI_014371 [Rhododendron griersonianum]|uniref:Protein YIPF n=1 Tax=Rhododendron griersonianum TaxID=479676 RepID=A0AAV6K916_9ERIC|nr:hypothetical protein RHGRI_014371 [Rhododendron griersonianum]
MFNECYTPTFKNGETVFPRETPFVDISTSSGTPTSNAIPAATRTNANTPRSNANSQTSNANAPTTNVVQGRPKKKVKVDGNEAPISVAMENLLAQSNTAFNKIADAVGYEDRLSAKREKVFMGYSIAVICPILYSFAVLWTVLDRFMDRLMDCFGKSAFWQIVGQVFCQFFSCLLAGSWLHSVLFLGKCYYHGSSWQLLLLFVPLPVLVFCSASYYSATVMALAVVVFRAFCSAVFSVVCLLLVGTCCYFLR